MGGVEPPLGQDKSVSSPASETESELRMLLPMTSALPHVLRRSKHRRIEILCATQHTLPLTVETPAAAKARTQQSPPTISLNGQRITVAHGTEVAVGNRQNEQARQEPHNDDAHRYKKADEQHRIDPVRSIGHCEFPLSDA